MSVDEDWALENSKYVTNLLVDEFNISMKITSGDTSWFDGKNERHNRSIHNMVRSGLIDSKLINMQIIGAVQQIHQQKYIYANSTVNYTITRLPFYGMFKILSSMNL